MEERQVFQLFSCCQITEGVNRALLTDTQRWVYYTIPLALSKILKEKPKETIEETKEQFHSAEEKKIIEEYFNFLMENELVFLCNESMAGYFPPIGEEFDFPAVKYPMPLFS